MPEGPDDLERLLGDVRRIIGDNQRFLKALADDDADLGAGNEDGEEVEEVEEEFEEL